MATPKTYKKKINFEHHRKIGEERREELKEMITDKDTFLPKGILHKDLDNGFKHFINEDLELILNGEKVPVIMMGIQRWNEFTRSWTFTDKYKNIKIPFITIVRQPDTQRGSNPLLSNVPPGRTYTYAEVPTFDGNKRGLDIYKIPQPVPIDINYEIRIFSYRQKELNEFNKIVLDSFQDFQSYTKVNGHFIPLILENITDESAINDIEKKRFYVQRYDIQLQGFILDPKKFEVKPAIDRVFTITEISKNEKYSRFSGKS